VSSWVPHPGFSQAQSRLTVRGEIAMASAVFVYLKAAESTAFYHAYLLRVEFPRGDPGPDQLPGSPPFDRFPAARWEYLFVHRDRGATLESAASAGVVHQERRISRAATPRTGLGFATRGPDPPAGGRLVTSAVGCRVWPEPFVAHAVACYTA